VISTTIEMGGWKPLVTVAVDVKTTLAGGVTTCVQQYWGEFSWHPVRCKWSAEPKAVVVGRSRIEERQGDRGGSWGMGTSFPGKMVTWGELPPYLMTMEGRDRIEEAGVVGKGSAVRRGRQGK
jgi:hypothetical protein